LGCYFASVPKEGGPSGHLPHASPFYLASAEVIQAHRKLRSLTTSPAPPLSRQLRRSSDPASAVTSARIYTNTPHPRSRIAAGDECSRLLTDAPRAHQNAVLQERLQVQGRDSLRVQKRKSFRTNRETEATMGGIVVAQRCCA
jgi:hypothetical protein